MMRLVRSGLVVSVDEIRSQNQRLRIVRKIKGEVEGAKQRECGREDGSIDT
jgi:hypothetical protein